MVIFSNEGGILGLGFPIWGGRISTQSTPRHKPKDNLVFVFPRSFLLLWVACKISSINIHLSSSLYVQKTQKADTRTRAFCIISVFFVTPAGSFRLFTFAQNVTSNKNILWWSSGSVLVSPVGVEAQANKTPSRFTYQARIYRWLSQHGLANQFSSTTVCLHIAQRRATSRRHSSSHAQKLLALVGTLAPE